MKNPRGRAEGRESANGSRKSRAVSPSLLDDDDDLQDPKPAWEQPPDRYVDGKINIEHFRVRFDYLNRLNEWHLRRGNPLKNYNSHVQGLVSEAKLLGLMEEAVRGGSAEDRFAALAVDLLDDPSVNRLLEADDDVLAVMERRMNEAVTWCLEEIKAREATVGEEVERYRKRVEQGKVWLSRLKRVRWLRTMARLPIPPKTRSEERDACEAAHVLRWLVYVFRSDVGSGISESSKILDMPRHIGKWAVDYWVARNGAVFYMQGDQHEIVNKPHLFKEQTGWAKKCFECKGIVLIGPPRHMKTTFGFGAVSLNLYLNNRLQILLNHAIEKDALKNYGYLADAFSPDTARGRRASALFPEVKIDRRNDSLMRLSLNEPTKDPQLRAVGVMAAIAGTNNDEQWWDDPVDPLKADNENERERVFGQLMDVFFRRLQGSNPFLLVTATLWNNDDPIARICRKAERGEFPIAVSIQRAGGPKSAIPFKPLWKERYPSSWLKTQYHSAGPFKYACQFEANPQPDDQRLIRRLSLYLSDTGDCPRVRDCRHEPDYNTDCGKCHSCLIRQHAEFLRSAEFHLSLDPSATSRENRRKTTDRSGFVYAAKGDVILRSVHTANGLGGMTTEDRVTRIRVLDALAFFAGPTEGLEHIASYSVTHKIDKVHIEQVTFSSALIEMFRNQFHLTASQVIGHSPRGLSKVQRLKAVAPMLDDAVRDFGLAPPVVEFPGVLDESGKLVPHPKFEWLFRQILAFGQSGEDHCVDAITQLLKHLMPECGVGEGAVSAAVKNELKIVDAVSAMKSRMLSEYEGAREDADNERNALEDEVLFMKRSA